jgi:hypothetical protein
VNTLASYLEMIVDPTWDDFHANRDSQRLAFLTCVAIFHAVDRVAEVEGKDPPHFRQIWRKECLEFRLVDDVAHHLKHVASNDEKWWIPGTLPIGFILGFNEDGGIDGPDPYYFIRDALRFVHRKAGTMHPTLGAG